jgi:outer membrane protein assembly factor BamA
LYEDVDVTGTLGAKIGRVRAGLSYGFTKINTGPGRDKRFPSTPASFDSQPDLRHLGLFIEHDSLDEPADPRSGGKYAFRWTGFESTLQRYEADARRFIPLGDEGRIGLRAQAIFTTSPANRDVPFFLLPTVGGVDTVRGFHQYRFRDRHALILNAEYRRPLVAVFDGVIFADAGRVFSRAGTLSLRDFAVSTGIGSRVRFGKRVFFGLDVGLSREGALLWFRSGHTF